MIHVKIIKSHTEIKNFLEIDIYIMYLHSLLGVILFSK